MGGRAGSIQDSFLSKIGAIRMRKHAPFLNRTLIPSGPASLFKSLSLIFLSVLCEHSLKMAEQEV